MASGSRMMRCIGPTSSIRARRRTSRSVSSASTTPKRDRALEHRFEHRRGQAAGILVVARGMIGAQQDAAVGRDDFAAVTELGLDRSEAQRPRGGGMGDGPERDQYPNL